MGLFFIVLLFVGSSLAFLNEPRATSPAQGDFCYIYKHRSALLGESLYFMGGIYTIQGQWTYETQQNLFRIDLSTRFPVNGLLPASSVEKSDAPSSSNWKGAGAFFADGTNTLLYTYGGFLRDYSPQSSMAMYNTTSRNWADVTVAGGNLNEGDRGGSMFASSMGTNLSLSFIQGGFPSDIVGFASNLTGMITFNSSDPLNPSWTNSTESSNTPATVGANMQFVRYGRSGVLIAFGGFITTIEQPKEGFVWNPREMSQIMVYDIASTKWYNVTATGDIPTHRDQFCTTVSYAPDGSSVNIMMYGGWTLSQARTWQDIYILSLPSFQWILVNSTGHSDNSPHAVGQAGMTCHLYKGRQMVALGGKWNQGGNTMNNVSCNAAYPSIRVLDTTDITWADHWSNTLGPYQVPQVVYQKIGGSATGRATTTQPQGGFNNSLDSVFSQTVPLSSTSQTGVSSIDPTPIPESSTPVGAIVGGVLGGVAAIVIAIGLFLYLRRRKAQQATGAENSELATQDEGIYSNDHTQNPRRHEVPGDFVQRGEYGQVPGPHEVSGDFVQSESGRTHAEPEVHELGPEYRVP